MAEPPYNDAPVRARPVLRFSKHDVAATRPPLPAGEGLGEGEADALITDVCAQPGPSRASGRWLIAPARSSITSGH